MYANNICTTCTAAITRVQRHSKTARRKPLLIFFLVLGFCILFCIFSVIRSSQTLSSLQYHTIENLVKIFNQTEKDSNTATGNTRQDHDTNRGSSGSSRHFWEQEDNPSCFHLDKICHGNGEWFYDDVHNNQVATSSRMLLNQPSITYSSVDIPEEYDPDERYYFNVSSPSASQNRTANNSRTPANCPYSSTPYHLSVQSFYNDMIGEFYSRTIRGLNEWMRDYPPKSEEDVQLYVHFASEERQTLFHGHRLFLGALPQNDKIDSFLSLIQNQRCQCFEKLIFCGYNLEDDNLDDEYEDDIIEDNEQTFFTADRVVHLDSDYACDKRGFRRGNRCTAYNHIRQDLLSRYERKDPLLQEKIREYRRNILLKNGVTPQQIGDVDEWKIVGLTDRKARRVWLNINEIIHTCETKFLLRKKVVCIKVNVEEANSIQAQLLMHMSLNSMIGIHGAQLSHGILLPQDGSILEILPWIP